MNESIFAKKEKLMLKIYQASAGSGKTFCLTQNYIKLLLQNWNSAEEDPENYKHILAVTFTNKATGEMKSRILSELSKMANNEKSDFIQPLMKELSEDEQTLRNKAKITLKHILHNYSHFSISTIDKFFQQVIRSFVRDIGLQGGYQVELDNERILRESIDALFLKISDDKELLDWLKNFAEEQLNDDKTWNISDNIYSFAKKSFSEKHSSFKIERTTLKSIKTNINKIISIHENTLAEKANKAIEIINKNNLSFEDFFRKGATFKQLEYIKQKNFEKVTDAFFKLPNTIGNWRGKKSEKSTEIENAYNGGLNDAICEICELIQNKGYNSAKALKEHIHTLGILTDISKAKNNLLSENNTILLSDSNVLLKNIIDDSDAPFVYEKIGTYINHFMIDEFQDTSKIQWENFLPLIENSLSAGNENLIVGDVKQSIYRWRNSDWDLLANKIYDNLKDYDIEQDSLKYNFRSKENIVNFNNCFFLIAKYKLLEKLQQEYNGKNTDNQSDEFKILAEKIRSAYDTIHQNLPQKTKDCQQKGHVKVEFLQAKNKDEYSEKVFSKLPDIIKQLQENGYQPKDIAFLVRNAKDGQNIADFFLKHKQENQNDGYCYDVISNDSLLISSSIAIKFIVWVLKYIVFNNDALTINMVSYYYHILVENIDKNEALTKDIPQEFEEFVEKIKNKPLFELTEEIIAHFSLGEKSEDCAYLQCFQDIVFDFAQKNNNDIKNFLNWWDENGGKKTLSTSENQNAMRIVTIHKSKGLDFEAVIIPFCSWEMKETSPFKQPMLWTSSNEEPFKELETFPIQYREKLTNTFFDKEYWEETLQEYIDNLNLIYVAFTRARNEMIIFTNEKITEKGDSSKENLNDIGYFVKCCLTNSADIKNEIADKDKEKECEEFFGNKFEENCFEMGVFETIDKKENHTENEEKMTTYIPVTQENNNESNLKMKLHSTDYFSEAENKINTGKLMHNILQRIYTIKDVDKILREMLIGGLISKSELPKIRLRLDEFFKIEGVSDWFDPKYKILNETDIIGNGNLRRPDRILIDGNCATIIDYKFGEKENDKYHSQVKEYMSLVEKMGYKAKGYICYAKLGKVVTVQ